MGKMQRTKGATGEREVANLFKKHGYEAHRSAMQQSQKNTASADVTVECEPRLWIEVKRGAQTRPMKALDQAIEACGEKIPVAFTRDDRDTWQVWMNTIAVKKLFDKDAGFMGIVMFPVAEFFRLWDKVYVEQPKKNIE